MSRGYLLTLHSNFPFLQYSRSHPFSITDIYGCWSLLFLFAQFEFRVSKLRFPTCPDAASGQGVSGLAAPFSTLLLGASCVQNRAGGYGVTGLALKECLAHGSRRAACTIPMVPENKHPAQEPGGSCEHPRNMQVSRQVTSSGDFPFLPPPSLETGGATWIFDKESTIQGHRDRLLAGTSSCIYSL